MKMCCKSKAITFFLLCGTKSALFLFSEENRRHANTVRKTTWPDTKGNCGEIRSYLNNVQNWQKYQNNILNLEHKRHQIISFSANWYQSSQMSNDFIEYHKKRKVSLESRWMFVLKLARFSLGYTVREKRRQFQNQHTSGLRRVVLILSKQISKL